MIICFNCSPETKGKMDNLIGKSAYSDYGQLIATAVDNLLVLESEVEEKGAVVIGETPAPSRTKPAAVRVKAERDRPNATAETETPRREVPQLFASLTAADKPSTLAPVSVSQAHNGDVVTLDRWVFGQHNRLLPAKVNCRAAGRLMRDNPSGMSVETACETISREAAKLGAFLAALDEARAAGRDDALATAFPGVRGEEEKGQVRYGSHFVATVVGGHRLTGLLSEYRFVELVQGDPARLVLTTAGWDFARLPNPLLDGPRPDGTAKFGLEEIDWLLEHVRQHVPAEYFAFRTLLAAIANGADTPDKLDEALAPLVPKNGGKILTPSYLASQRSGAISRMCDLALVTRAREGVRVSYCVTDAGTSYAKTRHADGSGK